MNITNIFLTSLANAFYITRVSDGSFRLPLRVTSSGGSLAHPAYMFDCAGEAVGKPAPSSI